MAEGLLVVLGIGVWATSIVITLLLTCGARRARHDAARRLDVTALATATGGTGRARERDVTLLWLLLLAVAAVLAAMVSRASQWEPGSLVILLAVLAVGTSFLSPRDRPLRISGAFVALVLAMAVLGPAPAAAIGVLCVATDAIRTRRPASLLAANAATYAVVPLVGGLLLQWTSTAETRTTPDGAYALLVFGVFVLANGLNFVLLAGHVAAMRQGSVGELLRSVYARAVPLEVAKGVVTAVTVLAFERYGAGLIGLFSLVLALGIFHTLLKAVLEGHQQSRALGHQAQQLATRHERMLGLMLHTLSLRDPTAARHAAAVAYYARHLARAAGLSPAEQQVVHTAGLLHDIGKQGLPDSILTADHELSQSDRRLVARHPLDGARLVREVPGLERVADAVLAHHERPDGGGYPHGLKGEEIPQAARIIAIAESYDALTAPDSYRRPVTVTEALEELRAHAGTQFDPALVERFVATIEELGAAGFRRRGDADLEVELRLQRGARDLGQVQPSRA